jgi:myo-inositol-1(or 4)-monophosphatase
MLFPNPEHFLDEIEAIALSGAEALLPFWRRLKDDQVSEKAQNDLITAADQAAENKIISDIRARYPDHHIVAEESGANRGSEGEPTWVIDPLDGTTNFVHGFAHFAVSIGVMSGDQVEFGVIYDPVKKDVFRAARGRGATWNGEPMMVSLRSGLAGGLLATGFPFKAHAVLDQYLDIFREVFLRAKAIRRPGAASLDLAYTACGVFDGFFEFQLSPWDLAAGTLMVEEAGGAVTDMNGGRAFLASGDVVCGSTGVHRELLQIISEIDDRE